MSALDPSAGPEDQQVGHPSGHPMVALPDPSDRRFEEEKKHYASADVTNTSDLEKGSHHDSHATREDHETLTPPTGPPFGEPEKRDSKYSLSNLYSNKWVKILIDLFCVAVILGW